jgi:hypothetical protein
LNSNEVTNLLSALRSGSVSLDDVAKRFRARNWVKHSDPDPDPESYMALAAAAQLDPRTDVPGSFDEVTAAYDRGELTSEQYRVLSDAVADSINAEYEARERGSRSTSE